MKTPRLKLASTQTAVTYSFRATGGDFGWANCTVNDSTGDLHISSDWGNWSHRWDPRPSCLGAPSLTALIGSRNNVDYLARKLQGERGGKRFSAEKTVTEWRRMLCERRMDDGRILMAAGEQAIQNAKYGVPFRRLTKEVARNIWEALGEAEENCGGEDSLLFLVHEIDGFTRHVDDTPYESIKYEQTAEDRALREVILPALIEECRGRTAGTSLAYEESP